jgi:hypothetical protein
MFRGSAENTWATLEKKAAGGGGVRWVRFVYCRFLECRINFPKVLNNLCDHQQRWFKTPIKSMVKNLE